MSLKASLPGARQAIVEAGGTPSRPLYVFLQNVAATVDGLSASSGDVTIPELPISENANVVGASGFSIYTQGTLKTGIVRVLLMGDTQDPGNTQYYGSGPTGARGWFNVSDALAESDNVTLTVGADGVTTIGLADLPDSGTGAALLKLTRDAKGRISGTSAATTGDLTEGTNLYYTDARVRATPLTGLSVATATPVVAADSVLAGVGKLQAQANGKLTAASNLSDVASAAAARSNLGLGTAAVANTGNNGDGLVPLLSVGVGQTTLDLTGVTGRVTFSGTTAEADGDGKPVLNFSGKGGASVSGAVEQRIGVFSLNTDGSTTNNRGGSFSVILKQNGSNALTNRLNISYQGHTTPGVDNAQTIGASAARWSVVYAATGAINTSDAREKTAVAPLTDAELAAAADLSRAIGTYQWLTAVAEKGDAARHHAGLTVQQAIEIMQAHGLDPFRYGFICHDQWAETPEVAIAWPAQDAVLDDDGNVLTPAIEAGSEVTREYSPAGDRYSFRHDELLLFIARGIDARLTALETGATA